MAPKTLSWGMLQNNHGKTTTQSADNLEACTGERAKSANRALSSALTSV
jgi:hypothetical protein